MNNSVLVMAAGVGVLLIVLLMWRKGRRRSHQPECKDDTMISKGKILVFVIILVAIPVIRGEAEIPDNLTITEFHDICETGVGFLEYPPRKHHSNHYGIVLIGGGKMGAIPLILEVDGEEIFVEANPNERLFEIGMRAIPPEKWGILLFPRLPDYQWIQTKLSKKS